MTDITKELDHLRFGVTRSIRYHARREHWFQGVQNVILLGVFINSTAFAVNFLYTLPSLLALVASAFIPVLVGFSLVFRFSEKAYIHRDLRNRFVRLLSLIIDYRSLEGMEISEKITEWTIERNRIEAEEPGVMKVLDVACHNDLIRGMGYEKTSKEFVSIGWFQRLFQIQRKSVYPSGSKKQVRKVAQPYNRLSVLGRNGDI